ncbi:hypothetical protein O3G_MSEX008914 [Manduca sexta]|uniref:Uncharacterized protein n=1 Tax=Manduca sexta TaxID=7130 RepID=A0A921ZC67_MANSE|nr:hypothetical protein O3G_MSEX008914 [Manduca sexta]
MAAANIFRSAFGGLLRKSTTYRTPVTCRLSSVALQQKIHTVKAAVKLYNIQSLQNGVPSPRIQQYSTGAQSKPSIDEIKERVLKVCRAYDKLSGSQVHIYFFKHFVSEREIRRPQVQWRPSPHVRTY